jgi:hypothetical protein
VKWLADENFNNAILRGLRRRASAFKVVRAQDIEAIRGLDDIALLQFATDANCVVVTHDLATMVAAMREHLRQSPRCAPIVLVPDAVPVAQVVEDLLLLDECGLESDWKAGVIYLPLR